MDWSFPRQIDKNVKFDPKIKLKMNENMVILVRNVEDDNFFH